MDKSLLVRVFVPTTAGEPGEVGECATGYPVASDLILTCRHAVRPKDRDDRFRTEIRWHHHPDPRTKARWFELDKDPVVWESEELDAALLRCSRPDGLRGCGLLSEKRLKTGQHWESAGFPRVAKYEDVQNEEPFRGAVHSMAPDSSLFSIDVNVAPERPEDWSGASGMPICIEGTNFIVGILKQVPDGWKGERLHATPSAKLLACPKFRKQIGYDDQEKRRATLVKNLTALLQRSETAAEIIREKSRLCEGVSADAVAACLANVTDPNALAQGLRRAYAALKEARELGDSEQLREAQDVVVEAAQRLVPFLCDSGLVAELRTHLDGFGALNAEIPCWLEMVAEIYMAALEERRTLYRPRRSPTDYPRGVRNRPAPPIGGINDNCSKLESIQQDLERKFAGAWQDLRRRIDDIMIESLAATGPAMERRDSIEIAAMELETVSWDGRYYITARLPTDPKARAELEAGLAELSNTYRTLAILKLVGDTETHKRERQTYGHFNQMLPEG